MIAGQARNDQGVTPAMTRGSRLHPSVYTLLPSVQCRVGTACEQPLLFRTH